MIAALASISPWVLLVSGTLLQRRVDEQGLESGEVGCSHALHSTPCSKLGARLPRCRSPTPHWCSSSVRPGAGKSTWAAAHYREVEVVSSDALRRGRGQRDRRPRRVRRRLPDPRPDRRGPDQARAHRRRRHPRAGPGSAYGARRPGTRGRPRHGGGRVRHPRRHVPSAQRCPRPAGPGGRAQQPAATDARRRRRAGGGGLGRPRRGQRGARRGDRADGAARRARRATARA